MMNLFAAAMAEEVVVGYAEPGGKTTGFVETIMKCGKPVQLLGR